MARRLRVKIWRVRLGLTILTLFTVYFSGCLWQEKTNIDACPIDGEVLNTFSANSAMVANDIPLSDGFDPPVKPIDGKPWWLAQGQDFCVYNSKFKGYHLGEDWNWGKSSEDLGKPVYAASNGKVRWAGNAGASWGGVVIIDHVLPDGTRVTSMYAHLQNVIPTGTIVKRGDKIGEIGPTPKGSTGPHLHFEIRTDPSIKIGPGYGKSCTGWTDPSTFIATHRPPLVSAQIVQYCPPYDTDQPLMVYAQQPFAVILTFENTCEIEWDFLARALVQDPSGKTVLDVWSSPLKVKPNELADWAEWLTISSSGKYYLEFSVWKDKQTLLDKSPKKIPIQALEPFSVPGTVTYHPLSDCWTIEGDDGHSYYPINLPREFEVNGLKVRFKGTKTVGYEGCIFYADYTDYVWWCGGEFPIRILEIQELQSVAFQYPLQIPWLVSQDFGVWNNTFKGYHLAEDVPAPGGTPVYASADGTVKFARAGTIDRRGRVICGVSGYCAVVIIEHDTGSGKVTTLYGHLSTRRGLKVKAGDKVSKGDLIGYVADDDEDGGVWKPHLHFGIRRGPYSTTPICGRWPYVGYTQSCKGVTHQQYLAMWYDPSDFIQQHISTSAASLDTPLTSSWLAIIKRDWPNKAIQFQINDPEIGWMQISIFDLSGRKVFDSGEVQGNILNWNLQDNTGQPLANGVYLYAIRVRGFDGREYVSEVRKLVILR